MLCAEYQSDYGKITHRCAYLWHFNGMDLRYFFCSFAPHPPLSFLWHTLDTEECSCNTGRPQCYAAKFGTKWDKWRNLSGSAAHKESVDEITYIAQLGWMEKSVKLEFFINFFSKKHFLVCVLEGPLYSVTGCGLGVIQGGFWLADSFRTHVIGWESLKG